MLNFKVNLTSHPWILNPLLNGPADHEPRECEPGEDHNNPEQLLNSSVKYTIMLDTFFGEMVGNFFVLEVVAYCLERVRLPARQLCGSEYTTALAPSGVPAGSLCHVQQITVAK